ncbi:MAG: hypothetical protein U9N73_10985, partial [Candidatus Auribacterota bacterium]|nr:hypothetical protein [Candidatus Auribacterota bacterium]
GGKEVAKRIRKIDQQAKIIASSGYSTDPIMSDFKKFGFDGALTKPYQIKELSQILDQVIGSGVDPGLDPGSDLPKFITVKRL